MTASHEAGEFSFPCEGCWWHILQGFLGKGDRAGRTGQTAELRQWFLRSNWHMSRGNKTISQPLASVIIQQLRQQPNSRAICMLGSGLDGGDSCKGAVTLTSRKSRKGKVPSLPPVCGQCDIFDQTSKALTCAVTT